MEAFLHYLWAQRRWERLIPVGQWEGLPLEVLDTGRLNYHAGPDFLEARVRIGELLWCGAVEIHRASQEWCRHGHDHDPAYRAVILHVVERDDRPVSYPSGEAMPTCLLLVPEELRQEEQSLLASVRHLPCLGLPLPWGEEQRRSFFTCLYRLRLRAKVKRLEELVARSDGDWAQAGYAYLLRYLGFGLNNEAFEQLASLLPLHLLDKHRDDEGQLEALLLGVAGLLDYLPAGQERLARQEEYAFLAYKYSLRPLPAGVCRRARTRPANLPEYRLLQLVQLLRHLPAFPAVLCQDYSPARLCELLRHPLPRHWQGAKGQGTGMLSPTACYSLYLNVFLPFRLAYEALYGGLETSGDPAELLRGFPAEDNRVTRLLSEVGLAPTSALESQALLELHANYCRAGACARCPRGQLGQGL